MPVLPHNRSRLTDYAHTQELQRLRGKWEEAASEAEQLRAESEGLKATVETLRSSAAAVTTRDDSESAEHRASQTDKEAEVNAGTEAREEISRLHKTIEELEDALKANSGSGGDGESGGGGGRGEGRGTDHDKDRSGDQDGAGEADGETAETTKEVIEERGRLRTDLRQARKEAATRAAGLEMQLADKEVRVPPLAPRSTRHTFVFEHYVICTHHDGSL